MRSRCRVGLLYAASHDEPIPGDSPSQGEHGTINYSTMSISDLNVLYEAFRASMKGSAWKEEPQRFEIDFLTEIIKLKKEIETRTYTTSKGSEFILNERGKTRYIHGARMRDRVVRHAFCDHELGPKLTPYLIHNNGASQPGKGISFSRKMFEQDLHSYWIEHGTNEGYVGFVDLSKFYDNIQHDKIREAIGPKISEEGRWLLDEVLKSFEIDVSYMTDEEFASCMSWKYDSIKYHETVPEEAKTGEKWMKKSVDIGDQASQDIGIFFPTPIDNYAKIVRGCKRYGRYMDDIYIIMEDKRELRSVIEGIYEKAAELGLFINEHKTHIMKLSGTFKYLQIRYSLKEDGRVIRRINPRAMARERRKLKAYKHLMEEGRIGPDDIEEAFKSWLGTMMQYMSNQQITNIIDLYEELFGRTPTWKKSNSRLRWLMAQRSTTSRSTATTSSHRRR